MTGGFEVFLDTQLRFRFRLLDADGAVLAVSCPFLSKREAAAGIAALRECAGTGLIADLTGHRHGPGIMPVTGVGVPVEPYPPEVLEAGAS
jgi:uncharacterized protein YegP (UPF0339 family)